MGPNNNNFILPTNFTYGTKGKGKVVYALALTDWVRGTEHLEALGRYFLGFESEGGQPFLYVKSADGRQELRIDGDEIQRLQASSRTLGPSESLTHRPRPPGLGCYSITVHYKIRRA